MGGRAENRKAFNPQIDGKADVAPSSLVYARSFEIALVLVRLDHIASVIVNANHGVV
jgi:hypothetical protein